MKVRYKLWIAMTALILFMGSAFFAISHGYLENLFRQYAMAAQEQSADQLARQVAYYYQVNGDSWLGVDQYIAGYLESPGYRSQFISFTLRDANGHVLVTAGPQSRRDASDTTTVTIQLGGRNIGFLTVSNRVLQGSPVEQNILHLMTAATVWGTILTSLVALIVGVWLMRIMTDPLQALMKAMQRLKNGDLDARVEISSKDEFGEVARTFNEMTSRLSRMEEARRHLVADVAHELRTPLTIMQGQLELIQQGVKPAEPATLLPIQDEVVRLTRLVQDLHQLSLAEVGKLPLEKVSTDIVKLLKRMVSNFEVEADDKGIRLEFEAESPGPVVTLADPNRITQVFVNLLGNAFRYTPPGGTVRVTVGRDANTVRVTVSDTGSGIPKEHLPHVFDRFYRAEEDRSRGSGGTGLGLAIAKEFVEAHGGRIEVASTVGKGTTFTVYLPGNSAETSLQATRR